MPSPFNGAVLLPGTDPQICSGHHQLSTQTIFSSCWAHSQPSLPCPWLCHVTELSQWGVSESRICRCTVWPFGPSHVWNRTRDHHEGMGRSTGTGVETVHDKLKRNRQVSSCTNPVRHLSKVESASLGVCTGSDFGKCVAHSAIRGYDSVGEFRVMFVVFFVFCWSFTRVMNCFCIKNKALFPEMKTAGSLLSCWGGAPLSPSWLTFQLPAPKNVGRAPSW